MDWTRREIGKLALSALPAAALGNAWPAFAFQARPNSTVRGVTIGMNVPYNFGGRSMPIDQIIQNCVQLGVSAVELRTQPVEAFLGVPENLVNAGRGAGGSGRRGEAGSAERGGSPSPEQDAARKAAADELRTWRLAVPMDKVREVRKRFDDAGVLIEIVKVDGIITMADAETDYAFSVAKTLGARAISTEIALEGTKRLGSFADKHKLPVGYHGHATTTAADFETAFSYAKYNGANLDIGHFVAGQNTSPVPFIKQHHDRITHIHVKDRKLNNGPNVPFGQGDTPIKEVLQLIRDNKWKIQATIEFEYPVPEGSDRMTEIKKSIDYCRAALQ
jgi:sugar phosphate isomerase/epimerase